jgi:positive regulator of sigma E activity
MLKAARLLYFLATLGFIISYIVNPSDSLWPPVAAFLLFLKMVVILKALEKFEQIAEQLKP